MAEPPIDPGADIGHVHLKVADLDRALAFYTRARSASSCSSATATKPPSSPPAATTITSASTPGSRRPASRRPPAATGLFHLAIRYPTRRALAVALQRLLDHGIRIEGAADHGVSEALYLSDPDGNGIELYRDRPRDQWPEPAPGDQVAMHTRPLDLQNLLAELPE